MQLRQVIPEAPGEAGGLEITSLAYDARRVLPGALFFCVPGFKQDGHEFALQAVQRGAVALVVERKLPELDVPQVMVPSARVAMAPAAAAFFGEPTAQLQVAGVTGTNGKTTTAFLLRALLQTSGRETGLLGTVKSVVGGVAHEVARTTPEAMDLQQTFREMLSAGDGSVVMEVSSHALALHRADAIHFDVAVFTNLTQDHLDFHPDMEDYFQAKRRLFVELAPRRAVINVDDPYGARLARELPAALTYGVDGPADYRARDLQTSLDGSSFILQTPEEEVPIRSPLTGRFNVLNVLAAFAAASALDVPAEVCAQAILSAGQVPGRFELVDAGQPFAVVVDYAHTPDSLENVLRAARGLTRDRLHVVFGAGGDRDRGKRPLMGRAAAQLADRVIVTSDNPRSEDPEAILDEILSGSGSGVEREVDRRRAIARALHAAAPGDVVVLAGKGHEQGQEFAHGRKIPFDDVTAAREILGEMGSTQSSPAAA